MSKTPERKTILFHIGPPKTGTTSIQGALVRHSRTLEERGIWFPYDRELFGDMFPSRSAPNSAPQTESLMYFVDIKNIRKNTGKVDWKSTLEKFLNEGSAHTLIVSHENFLHNGQRLRGNVFHALREHADLKFISYIRHPLSYLSSHIGQGIASPNGVAPRHEMGMVKRYVKSGFSGLLAPFEEYGRVEIASYDKLNTQNKLIEDLFDRFGEADLISAEPPVNRSNASSASLGLNCVYIALKLQGGWNRQDWIDLRGRLERTDKTLDIPLTPSLLTKDLAAVIQDRWLTDREMLNRRYATSLPTDIRFEPGPDKMVITQDYADTLWQAVQSKLNDTQKERLRRALDMVGEDLEAHLAVLPARMQPIRA